MNKLTAPLQSWMAGGHFALDEVGHYPQLKAPEAVAECLLQ